MEKTTNIPKENNVSTLDFQLKIKETQLEVAKYLKEKKFDRIARAAASAKNCSLFNG
jgi:hypothetical protein